MRPSSDKNQPTASRRTPRRPRRRVRIILLDDVTEVRESILAIVRAQWADAEIVECENGDEAWKLVQESLPDLLISDLAHPGLGGEELSKRLADAHPDLPMLDLLREQHQANPQLTRGFLAKPFTVEALQAEIERLIAVHLAGP